MVERSLSMREVRGSIPRISKFFDLFSDFFHSCPVCLCFPIHILIFFSFPFMSRFFFSIHLQTPVWSFMSSLPVFSHSYLDFFFPFISRLQFGHSTNHRI
ncbi:hypothetical protein BS78_08G024000 [Paspalum vaginatum]|nr:hypothetical protein BS78_08G024000 [Paspalum vaginatum]